MKMKDLIKKYFRVSDCSVNPAMKRRERSERK